MDKQTFACSTLVFAFKLRKGLGKEEWQDLLSISAFFSPDFDLLSQQGQNSIFSKGNRKRRISDKRKVSLERW